jgi:hypothetical protein
VLSSAVVRAQSVYAAYTCAMQRALTITYGSSSSSSKEHAVRNGCSMINLKLIALFAIGNNRVRERATLQVSLLYLRLHKELRLGLMYEKTKYAWLIR